MLGLPRGNNTGGPNSPGEDLNRSIDQAENFLDLPQSVLQIVAKSLQCDILIAAVLNNSTGLAETVLCVPKGQITVPVRLSKGLVAAATSCEVLAFFNALDDCAILFATILLSHHLLYFVHV